MIITLITGFVVGVFFERAAPFLNTMFERVNVALDDTEMNLATFALCLAAASAVLLLIGVKSYPVLLCLAAACGVARKPLLARITGNR
ncbi:hypothetical protein [Planktotalea sp.]|uniref:hypothetical protein n=1 Tax=Planktotalea sp. TaxID=2029877 RepID=UPI003296B024